MASWRIFRVRLNFLSYSLRRHRPRRNVLLSRKLWPPSRWSCKAYKLYCSAGLCLPGNARPKTIAPSWPKVVRPVADGKDVASCACQLIYSWLHSSKTDDIMELLLLLQQNSEVIDLLPFVQSMLVRLIGNGRQNRTRQSKIQSKSQSIVQSRVQVLHQPGFPWVR